MATDCKINPAIDSFSLLPSKENDLLGAVCLDCLFAMRAIYLHPGSGPLQHLSTDPVADIIEHCILNDNTAPLSLVAAASSGLVCMTPSNPILQRRQLIRVLRMVVSRNPEDCSLTLDEKFYEPLFRVAVLRILACAADKIAHYLDDLQVGK